MRLSVVVLVAVALLQPGSSQHGTQETEENHSTNGGRDQLTVLNLDHYLLLLNNKLDTLSSKVEQLHTIVSQYKQQTAAELAQLQTSLNITKSYASRLHGPYMCANTTGWRRVVYLDMTDPSTTCPSGWQLTGYSKRTCGRATDGRRTCDSVTFPVSGGEYSRVCGRIKAYQWGATLAFYSYHHGHATTIDGAYVDGISVTHSRPQQHIWTFAAGLSENFASHGVCPCDSSLAIRVPPFVGGDYFCESGVNEPWDAYRHYGTLYSNDPLWDGENCLSSSTCCSLHNPPYFVKQLPTPTTDDIEAQMCLYFPLQTANIALELIELYVQ